MIKRITDWKYLLGIAFFAFGISYASQDSTKISTTTTKSVNSPAPEKNDKPIAKPAVNAKKSNSKEEIIDEEDFLLPEKGESAPQKTPATATPAPLKKDTSATNAAAPLDTNKQKSDSAGVAAQQKATETPAASTVKTETAPVVKQAVPIKIEDVRPINFARNLKDYKSPKLAMILSLCIPGLGQVYIGKTSNYVKAGLYVLAEGAIIGLSAYYNHRGDTKIAQAKAIANGNYDPKLMQQYYDDLKAFFASPDHGNMTDSAAKDKMNEIYFDSALINFQNAYKSGPSQDYYNTIGTKAFVQGWKDCEPTLYAIENAGSGGQITGSGQYNYQVATSDTTTMGGSGSYLINLVDKTTNQPISDETFYGHSAKADQYNSIISDANNHDYKYATNILFVILINHIVSSIDALISAKVYNDELLGKQSFLEKISIEPASTLSFSTVTPGIALKVRF